MIGGAEALGGILAEPTVFLAVVEPAAVVIVGRVGPGSGLELEPVVAAVAAGHALVHALVPVPVPVPSPLGPVE